MYHFFVGEKDTVAYFGAHFEEQLKIYSTVGGTPHLDGQYTVFGEVEVIR